MEVGRMAYLRHVCQMLRFETTTTFNDVAPLRSSNFKMNPLWQHRKACLGENQQRPKHT